MPSKTQTSVAALLIAIAVFATIVSAVDFSAPVLVLLAAWQIVPVVHVVAIPQHDEACREQTSALVALLVSRPPPALRFA